MNKLIVEDHICQLVLKSSFIEEIDISHNKLDLVDLQKLLFNLSKNRRLKYLNLSWNSMYRE